MLSDPVPQLKQQLSHEILDLVTHYPLGVGAEMLGLDLSRMSRLAKGDLERFSLEKLIRILAFVDRRVTIAVVDESTMSLGRMMRERFKRESSPKER